MTKTLIAVSLLLLMSCATAASKRAVLFDDFNYATADDLARHRWIVRTEQGWPGVPGATWGKESVAFIDDPTPPGNRLLRMTSMTAAPTGPTRQAQICHERKYLEGTYAARVRFYDQPQSGRGGDQIVETFYFISPLKAPMDPDYSESDFEYLPNGGWNRFGPTLFVTTWETFSPAPDWKADNVSNDRAGSLAGWHTLVAQIGGGTVRYFIDGEKLAEHTGRYYPESMMSINFNLWFISNGVIDAPDPRSYVEDIDWVFYEKGTVLAPADVEREVASMRSRSIRFTDSVPPQVPPLSSPCNF